MEKAGFLNAICENSDETEVEMPGSDGPVEWALREARSRPTALDPGFEPDYTARLPAATHRAAASALSSGRVLKAIAAPGAALRIALMTTSNSARCRDGRRTPPPITTQS